MQVTVTDTRYHQFHTLVIVPEKFPVQAVVEVIVPVWRSIFIYQIPSARPLPTSCIYLQLWYFTYAE